MDVHEIWQRVSAYGRQILSQLDQRLLDSVGV